MDNILFKVNFIPDRNIFSITVGAHIWELSPEEYFVFCNNIFIVKYGKDIKLNFKKNPTSGIDLQVVNFSGVNKQIHKNIIEYLKKVKGSYQLSQGINDGQNKR